jgi:hypothetical protein
MFLVRLVVGPFIAVYLLVLLLLLFVCATLGFIATGQPWEVKANFPRLG